MRLFLKDHLDVIALFLFDAVDEAECERAGDGFEEDQRDDSQMVLQEKPHDPSPSMERR